MKFKFWDLNLYQFDISLVSVFTFYLYQNRVVLNPESDIGSISIAMISYHDMIYKKV